MRRCSLLLAAAIALAAPRAALAQTADEQFKQGREAMNKGDFKRALDLLKASQAAAPGKGKLLNVALCEEELGLFASAKKHLSELAPQFPDSDERAGIVRQHLASVEAKGPHLRVALGPGAPAGTTVTVDGDPLPAASLGNEVLLDAGKHVVIASAPGATDRRYEVELAAGKRVTLPVAPEASGAAVATPTPEEKPGRPIGWIAGVAAVSAGGAAVVAGIGVGAAALGKRATLASKCDANRMCPPDQQSTIDGYHALGGASTGLIIAGGLVAAGGAVLMVLAPGAKPATSGWIAPEIGLGMVGVRGRF
jgi:hypothetical protein